MRIKDKECIQLAEIQADLFEKATKTLDMSSNIFFRRFMNSNIAKDFDNAIKFGDGQFLWVTSEYLNETSTN